MDSTKANILAKMGSAALLTISFSTALMMAPLFDARTIAVMAGPESFILMMITAMFVPSFVRHMEHVLGREAPAAVLARELLPTSFVSFVVFMMYNIVKKVNVYLSEMPLNNYVIYNVKACFEAIEVLITVTMIVAMVAAWMGIMYSVIRHRMSMSS